MNTEMAGAALLNFRELRQGSRDVAQRPLMCAFTRP
jgi:hypothetical protein